MIVLFSRTLHHKSHILLQCTSSQYTHTHMNACADQVTEVDGTLFPCNIIKARVGIFLDLCVSSTMRSYHCPLLECSSVTWEKPACGKMAGWREGGTHKRFGMVTEWKKEGWRTQKRYNGERESTREAGPCEVPLVINNWFFEKTVRFNWW